MAIKIEQHDGMTRTFSDDGHWIIQDETGAEYHEAWDPIDYPRSYTESERLIEIDEPELTEEEIREAAAFIKAAKIMLGSDDDE